MDVDIEKAGACSTHPIGENEAVCEGCARLFCIKTGEIMRGWENVAWVETSPLICKECKDRIIEQLQRALPVGQA